MNLHQAIYQLNPSVVTIRGDVAYDANDNVVAYDTSQAEALVAANAYKLSRAKEYPSIQEQMDMQYWDAINGTTTWQDAINAVKTKYPKGA
jgi:ribosome-interacting GTPase 1